MMVGLDAVLGWLIEADFWFSVLGGIAEFCLEGSMLGKDELTGGVYAAHPASNNKKIKVTNLIK